MKMKIALGVLLVSMSAAAFAQPGYYDRDRHHPRAESTCFANGQAYRVGSVIKKYHRVQVCERVRGRAMWIQHHR